MNRTAEPTRAPYPTAPSTERALIVAVDLGNRRRPLEPELAEYQALIEAAGARIVGSVVQARNTVDAATLVGKGKAHEIADHAAELGATKIFVFNDMRPRQRTNLEKIIPLPIVDRSTVILDIFAQRARSREGKLQVELAQLRHRQANLIGAETALSRLGGGVGTRGPGETKLEVDRRRIGERISHLRAQLETVRKSRAVRRDSRERLPLVALVGYTNVGKSSLLNRLSHATPDGAAFVADQPFATLDPTLRKVFLAPGVYARVADTVGFITELPRELINAFRATLEELDGADVLVHVLDASNPDWPRQKRSVEAILHELGVGAKPTIVACNKIDARDAVAEPSLPPDAIPLSVRTGAGIDQLRASIAERLEGVLALA
jgi:GTP-binding protein HflX